jgi:dCMP deaminase
MFMDIAHVVAKRSTCARLNVGAVLTYNNRIVSIGYNGQDPGEKHCVGAKCPSLHHAGACNTIHAEQNAIEHAHLKKLKDSGIEIDDSLHIYVTDSPCMNCAFEIADAGVTAVFFSKAYRDVTPLTWLKTKNVSVFQVMPGGLTLTWPDRNVVEL